MNSNASADRLTHDQIKETVTSALTPEAVSIVDREGASDYNRAGELINELSRIGMSDEIVDILTEVGRENLAQDVSWWLRFLGFFDNIRLMTAAQRMKISDILGSSPPRDPEARAYILRFLAYSGCPIAWDRLSKSFDFSELLRTAPLIFADALVWAQKYDDAFDVVSAYLNNGGPKDLLSQMLERWTDLEPLPSSNEFLTRVKTLINGNDERFAAIENFGEDIRSISSGYNADPFRMVPEPAE